MEEGRDRLDLPPSRGRRLAVPGLVERPRREPVDQVRQALNRVQLQYAKWRQLTEQERKIQIDMVGEPLANLARAEGKTTVAVRQALDRAGRLGPLRAQLRREKTMRHLMGESTELEMTDSDDTVEQTERDDQD